jgi:NAD+ synthase
MCPQLRELTEEVILEFIRQKVEESGSSGVVVGLSGGVDSAVTSRLCAQALGPQAVLNLFMPSRTTPPLDGSDAEEFCQLFGMELRTVDIQPAVDALVEVLPEMSDPRLLGNAMARTRMTVLFHHAKLLGRLVMGTSNKSELLVGYFTKFGDGGADFCPIGDLYKSEVRELARNIGVPQRIIDKAPTAGLWEGQTDEGELGIAYEELDQILVGFELHLSNDDIARRADIPVETVERVWQMHRSTVHKRKTPLIPKLGLRTIGLDWRE